MAEGETTTFTALTEKFNLPLGNYKKPKLLYCSNGGYFLRILPDGTVDGTKDRSDQHRECIPDEGQGSLSVLTPINWEREVGRGRRKTFTISSSVFPIQLQLCAESIGEVYIKSTETGQFLAMDTDGLLYGSQTPNEECLFLERLEENHYNTYISKKHAEKHWFVGLKKNGRSKLGPRTHFGQKAILFLPLPVSSD
uniref:Multifunctional fusion protein n=1 Tax=Bos mutus grunniens TaxID=30521 RepID=A0A8B9X9B7_BOSMU